MGIQWLLFVQTIVMVDAFMNVFFHILQFKKICHQNDELHRLWGRFSELEFELATANESRRTAERERRLGRRVRRPVVDSKEKEKIDKSVEI